MLISETRLPTLSTSWLVSISGGWEGSFGTKALQQWFSQYCTQVEGGFEVLYSTREGEMRDVGMQ